MKLRASGRLAAAAACAAMLAACNGRSATIVNSGSTNTPGFTIRVSRSSESAEATISIRRASQTRALAPRTARSFYDAIKAAQPLDRLGVRRCAKSASFGTRTFVEAGGRRSPDISCGGDARTERLRSAVRAIERALDFERL